VDVFSAAVHASVDATQERPHDESVHTDASSLFGDASVPTAFDMPAAVVAAVPSGSERDAEVPQADSASAVAVHDEGAAAGAAHDGSVGAVAMDAVVHAAVPVGDHAADDSDGFRDAAVDAGDSSVADGAATVPSPWEAPHSSTVHSECNGFVVPHLVVEPQSDDGDVSPVVCGADGADGAVVAAAAADASVDASFASVDVDIGTTADAPATRTAPELPQAIAVVAADFGGHGATNGIAARAASPSVQAASSPSPSVQASSPPSRHWVSLVPFVPRDRPSRTSGDSVLHRLASYDYESDAALERALAGGAAVNAANAMGATPLHLAVRLAYFPGMRLLVSHGADVNAVDVNGKLAFLLATACHCSSPAFVPHRA
jgi:hypothetical protein